MWPEANRNGPGSQQGLAFGIRVESLPPPDREFVPGETVRVGTVGFTVRHALSEARL